MSKEHILKTLRALGGPDELVAQIEEHNGDLAELPIHRAHRFWLGGVSGGTVDELIVGEVEVLSAAIVDAIEVEECTSWIERIFAKNAEHELLATQIEERANAVTAGYREARQQRILNAYGSLAWIARAVGGIETARIRRASARSHRAQQMAAMLGAGESAFLRVSGDLAVDLENLSDSPVNSELSYAFAAIAEAHRLVSLD